MFVDMSQIYPAPILLAFQIRGAIHVVDILHNIIKVHVYNNNFKLHFIVSKPFPIYINMLMHLSQTTFGNVEKKSN